MPLQPISSCREWLWSPLAVISVAFLSPADTCNVRETTTGKPQVTNDRHADPTEPLSLSLLIPPKAWAG
jgi:hypothetical protein